MDIYGQKLTILPPVALTFSGIMTDAKRQHGEIRFLPEKNDYESCNDPLIKPCRRNAER